jgi:septal ring factor EnvC (AmiA/AmiB activator)
MCQYWRNWKVPDRSDQPTPTDDALRDELAYTQRDNARLRDELARVELDRAQLERQRDRLRRENERLKDELEAARRAGARQAAPFWNGAPVVRPKRPRRKAGAAHGRHG